MYWSCWNSYNRGVWYHWTKIQGINPSGLVKFYEELPVKIIVLVLTKDVIKFTGTSNNFGTLSNDLFKEFANIVQKLCTHLVETYTVEAFLSCRLILLDKNLRFWTIAAGEVLRRVELLFQLWKKMSSNFLVCFKFLFDRKPASTQLFIQWTWCVKIRTLMRFY